MLIVCLLIGDMLIRGNVILLGVKFFPGKWCPPVLDPKRIEMKVKWPFIQYKKVTRGYCMHNVFQKMTDSKLWMTLVHWKLFT